MYIKLEKIIQIGNFKFHTNIMIYEINHRLVLTNYNVVPIDVYIIINDIIYTSMVVLLKHRINMINMLSFNF